MPVKDFIAIYYNGNQALFAKAQGTTEQTVSRWIKSNFIIVKDIIYSPRCQLTEPVSLRPEFTHK